MIIEQQNITISEVGIQINPNTTLDEIKKELLKCQSTGELLPFAYGDILLHLYESGDVAKEKFVKQYESENKNRTQLQNYLKVAKNFTHKDRARYIHKLTFTHLSESLNITKDKAQAIKLLGIALAENLSVSQMRATYRRASAPEPEPGIETSPVNELCNLARELYRKINLEKFTEDEKQLLFASLSPLITWADNYLERKR